MASSSAPPPPRATAATDEVEAATTSNPLLNPPSTSQEDIFILASSTLHITLSYAGPEASIPDLQTAVYDLVATHATTFSSLQPITSADSSANATPINYTCKDTPAALHMSVPFLVETANTTEAEQVLTLLQQVTAGGNSITGLASDSTFNNSNICTFAYETTSTYELSAPFHDDDGGGIRTRTHIQTLNGGTGGGGIGTVNPPSWSSPPEIRVLDPIQAILASVAIAFLILLMGSAVMVLGRAPQTNTGGQQQGGGNTAAAGGEENHNNQQPAPPAHRRQGSLLSLLLLSMHVHKAAQAQDEEEQGKEGRGKGHRRRHTIV